tara:strand:+ start:618 stop:788 length:171 start_codon:yes stop_codon:yes gene_type:complete
MSILEDILEKHARKNDVDLSLIHEIIETQKKYDSKDAADITNRRKKLKEILDKLPR